MRNLQEDGQPGRAGAEAAATALGRGDPRDDRARGVRLRRRGAGSAACPSTGTPRRPDCCGSGVTDDPWSADALREKIRNGRGLPQPAGAGPATGGGQDHGRALPLRGGPERRTPVQLAEPAPRRAVPGRPHRGRARPSWPRASPAWSWAVTHQPLRFDMSEFRADEAHQRLIGAPPGYVGYRRRRRTDERSPARNPVCILLFDEIEKAHPRIFDLFLQILEDGRLTDGRGATVYFTECFLIFTSNLGSGRAGRQAGRPAHAYADQPGPWTPGRWRRSSATPTRTSSTAVSAAPNCATGSVTTT